MAAGPSSPKAGTRNYPQAGSAHNACMAIHMGVMCEACRRVHFIDIGPHTAQPSGEAHVPPHLRSALPRDEGVPSFSICAYQVAEDAFKSGFVKEGGHELVQGAKPKTGRQARPEGQVNQPQGSRVPVRFRFGGREAAFYSTQPGEFLLMIIPVPIGPAMPRSFPINRGQVRLSLNSKRT